MIFPFDRKDGFRDASTPRPTQRPASNSNARKRAGESGFSPVDGVSDPHLDNGFAEVIRKAKAEAWDEGARAVCPDPDRCWCEDYTHTPNRPHTPNPYRGVS